MANVLCCLFAFDSNENWLIFSERFYLKRVLLEMKLMFLLFFFFWVAIFNNEENILFSSSIPLPLLKYYMDSYQQHTLNKKVCTDRLADKKD